jgi:hypothetical protein
MRTIQILTVISDTLKGVSKQNQVYYKLMINPLASKVDGKWTAAPSIVVNQKVYPLTMIRVSEQTYNKWVKGKDLLFNILVLNCDEHIAGVTEYIKDGEVHKHGTKNSTLGDISFDVQSCIQSTYEIYELEADGVALKVPKEVLLKGIMNAQQSSNINRHE